jgi:hypothetical protein
MLSKIKKLSATNFENLIYDILAVLGLENAVWRTPGRDIGRDIEGIYFITDLSGHRQPQKWYIECKKYKSTIDWPTIRNKLSYAESHAAEFLLVVTTATASPQAVDEINRWNSINYKPKIRIWGGYKIVQILEELPAIQIKYGLYINPITAAAASVLPISAITLKFTQAAYSESVFREIGAPTLEAAAAMADLSTRRLEQIENTGNWSNESTKEIDIYAWVEIQAGIDVSKFDRYALRALLCIYRIMVKGTVIEIKKDSSGNILLSSDGKRKLEKAQRSDLLAIAFWGNFEIIFDDKHMTIAMR